MRALILRSFLFYILYIFSQTSGLAYDGMDKVTMLQSDSCAIIEMVEVSRRCDGDSHYLTIDLVTENVGTQFTVFRNGVFHRSFAYANLPVEIGPFENTIDKESTLFFEDKIYPGCSLTTTYTEHNCAGCELNSLAYSITNCRDGEFYLNFLNIEHVNTNSFYMLIINDNLIDTFSYDSIPSIIGPIPDVADEYEIFLYDVMQLDCFHSFSFPSPICYPIECELSNLSVAQTPCINETYNLVIDYDYQGTSTFFSLLIDGVTVSYYRYSNLPITYGPLVTPTGSLSHTIEVQDMDDEECNTTSVINIVDCRLYCEMSNLVVEQINCMDGTYELIVDFDYENASSEFNLVVDGRNEGNFNYTELPLTLGPLNSTGTKNIIVSVEDIEDTTCNLSTSIQLEDCRPECAITNVSYTELPCEENEFYITIDFDYSFTSNTFSIFSIDGNDEYGTFSYSELPLKIGPFVGDGNSRFILNILDSEGGCEGFLRVQPVLCTTVSNIESIEEYTLEITPNPTNSFFTIEHLPSGQIDLLSTDGNVVQSWNEHTKNYILNDTAPGLYIVRWRANDEVRYGKIIITQ